MTNFKIGDLVKLDPSVFGHPPDLKKLAEPFTITNIEILGPYHTDDNKILVWIRDANGVNWSNGFLAWRFRPHIKAEKPREYGKLTLSQFVAQFIRREYDTHGMWTTENHEDEILTIVNSWTNADILGAFDAYLELIHKGPYEVERWKNS